MDWKEEALHLLAEAARTGRTRFTRDAIRLILDHLEAQEAAKPPEPVEWRLGDLVKWKRGERMVQDRVHCVDGVDLWLKGLDFSVCAAECTLVKRAGE